jgi:hypothetical protein
VISATKSDQEALTYLQAGRHARKVRRDDETRRTMNVPDWTKLEISLADVDAPRLLRAWRWLVDEPLTPLALTRFGDWFVVDGTGAVHRIDALEGAFEQICGSASEFHARKSGDSELADWFQDGMVYAAFAAGMVPAAGEGLGYRVPPVLGASTQLENVVVVGVSSWQLFMSQLHDKLRFAPAGARVAKLEMDDAGNLEIGFRSAPGR